MNFPEGATILGASPSRHGLAEALRRAPALVCADGGANALPEGAAPEAIIGDLDSLADAEGWRARLGARLVHVAEQESTDLEKCLRHVDAPFLIGVGFLGGRLDHELAALHAMIAEPRPLLLIGEEDVALSAGTALSLDPPAGDRLSIYPLRPVRALAGSGLRWPIDGLEMEAAGRIGTSNQTTGPVSMRFDRPGAVVILPRARLDAALRGLLNRPRP
ncbi:MAG: thiamine diphosphokinase [Pikeienuella sp.]